MTKPMAERALKHGGAAAERALSTGADFTGIAAAVEKQVTDELDESGDVSIIRRNAIRLQTVSDIYFGAILGAKDLDRLDALVKRFGWIVASANRAWQQVRELEKNKVDDSDVLEIIERYRSNDEPQDN